MRLKSLHFYIVLVYALLNLNKSAYSQCATGTPQTVTHTRTGSPVSLFDSYNFPRFNPALGTLIGINYNLTTSGFTMLQLINGDGFDNSFTMMEFTRKDRVTLPGMGTVLISDSTVYYPDTVLGASHNPTPLPPYTVNSDGTNEWWGDALVPDGKTYSTVIPPAAYSNYTGTGAVTINYTIIPSFFALGIGSHYTLNYVTMATNINMSITYTYCVNSVLPAGKLDFFAKAPNNNDVELSWTKENEQNNILYGIEMSTNGVDFTSIGTMKSQKPETNGTVVKYEFDYNWANGISDKLYFRVKQTEAEGKIKYSAIKWVDREGNSLAKISVFPNPALGEVTLQFKTPPQNSVQVQLINSVGKIVQTSRINMNGSKLGSLSFNSKYAPGVYFLKVIDEKTKEQEVSRLIIK